MDEDHNITTTESVVDSVPYDIDSHLDQSIRVTDDLLGQNLAHIKIFDRVENRIFSKVLLTKQKVSVDSLLIDSPGHFARVFKLSVEDQVNIFLLSLMSHYALDPLDGLMKVKSNIPFPESAVE